VHQLRLVVEIPLFTRFHTFQVVVWDFFHQHYLSFREGNHKSKITMFVENSSANPTKPLFFAMDFKAWWDPKQNIHELNPCFLENSMTPTNYLKKKGFPWMSEGVFVQRLGSMGYNPKEYPNY